MTLIANLTARYSQRMKILQSLVLQRTYLQSQVTAPSTGVAVNSAIAATFSEVYRVLLPHYLYPEEQRLYLFHRNSKTNIFEHSSPHRYCRW